MLLLRTRANSFHVQMASLQIQARQLEELNEDLLHESTRYEVAKPAIIKLTGLSVLLTYEIESPYL